MKFVLASALTAIAIGNSSSVQALDCAKVSTPVEKSLCASPDLKRADAAMGAEYFKLLRRTTDPEFHDALIRSQRRWLTARSRGLGVSDSDDVADQREALLKVTRDRADFLRAAGPIRAMERQREVASTDSGGSFAGFRTSCYFLPPPHSEWIYACFGTVHRQHRDRICSLTTDWASGHESEYRLVSVVGSSTPTPVASCSIGYAATTERCPDAADDAAATADARWNTKPGSRDGSSAPGTGGLWKYDPDIQGDIADQPWMHECLSAAVYPPSRVGRSESTTGK